MRNAFKGLIATASLALGAQALALPEEWKLTTLDGIAAPDPTPGKDLQFVLFWASWCGICKEKMKGPMLEWTRSRPDLGIITVNIDRDAAKGKHAAQKEGITLPVYREENRDLRKKLGVFAAPHWVVYRRKDGKSPWEQVDTQAGWDEARVNAAIKKQ